MTTTQLRAWRDTHYPRQTQQLIRDYNALAAQFGIPPLTAAALNNWLNNPRRQPPERVAGLPLEAFLSLALVVAEEGGEVYLVPVLVKEAAHAELLTAAAEQGITPEQVLADRLRRIMDEGV